MFNRRQVMACAATLSSLPLAARAGASEEAGGGSTRTLADAMRFAIGDVRVTALSDGPFRLGPDQLSGIDAAGYAEAMEARFLDPDTWRAAVNGFLIESGDTRMLVDAGSGGALGPDLGQLMSNLGAVGVAPGDITTFLATHLHVDHVGGAVTDDGSAVFPNAEFVVSRAERDFWSDDGNMTEDNRTFFEAARAALTAYEDRLRLFEGDGDIAAGVSSVFLPGHTPGHSGYMISSGDASLLIWADIFHVAPVQMVHPEVTISFDVNPEEAVATRRRILDRVATDRTLVAGSHMDFPGLGHMRRAGTGYDLIDAPYPYGG